MINFNIIRSKSYRLFWLVCIVSITKALVQISIEPSNNVQENDTVKIRCLLSTGKHIAQFNLPDSTSCVVVFQNNTCSKICDKSVICENSKTFSLQTKAQRIWNNKTVFCEEFGGGGKSEAITFNITVPVKKVAVTYDKITVNVGQQINLTCKTDDCNPAADITWYKESSPVMDSNFHISHTIGQFDLITTTSVFMYTGAKDDNMQNVFCKASNWPGVTVESVSYSLNVRYPPAAFLPRITSSPSGFQYDNGTNVALTCQQSGGNPVSTLSWNCKKTEMPSKNMSNSTEAISVLELTIDVSFNKQECTCTANHALFSKPLSAKKLLIVVRPPTVHTLSQQDIIEGSQLSITCQATPGDPSFSTFYWTKADNPGFRQNGSTLQLPNIQRNSSGIYRCTAENNYHNGEKGSDSRTMVVNVLYPPTIRTLSQQDIKEGSQLIVNCTATPGNPSSTTFFWTKVDNSRFRQNGSTLQFYNIQRNSSGTYRCTAENNYNNGVKGTHSQAMEVNVLYQPTIERRSLQIVNKSEKITLIRDIVSNPLSDASWYYGTQLLKTQTSVTTATYTIENTTCTDTKNYTLVVSNGIGNTVKAMEELIVNCKPTPDITNITLAATCTTGIEFSTTIIAYPEPFYELQYENGTRNDQMITTIIENKVNNFTVRIRQDVVEKSSFGVYFLRARNMFGETTVIVNVVNQRRPDIPRNIKVTCKATGAIVQWISSFNGGDTQNFTVITLSGQDGNSHYYNLNDKGQNEIHATYVSSLQPSVTYWFSVSAKNSHGSISSKAMSCTTVKEIASSPTGIVAGSVGGALLLVTIIPILVFFVHRRYTCICISKKALEKRNIDIKVDQNKETSNYTTIKEQQEHAERNMYDELVSRESASQYEDVLKKDNHGKYEKLYEKLQKSVDNDGEGKAIKMMVPLKSKESSDDKSVTQKAEEYANTSFMK